MTSTSYTVYANNSGGTSSQSFSITVVEITPSLSITSSVVLTLNAAMTDQVTTNTGGPVATWSISPSLPSGLSMTNGVISGTPTTLDSNGTDYWVTGTNTGGSDSVMIRIRIVDVAPVLAGLNPVIPFTITHPLP